MRRAFCLHILQKPVHHMWNDVLDEYLEKEDYAELQTILLSTIKGKDWERIIIPLQRRLIQKNMYIPLKKTILYGDQRPFLRQASRCLLLGFLYRESEAWLQKGVLEQEIR